jgi:hypothetical protein
MPAFAPMGMARGAVSHRTLAGQAKKGAPARDEAFDMPTGEAAPVMMEAAFDDALEEGADMDLLSLRGGGGGHIGGSGSLSPPAPKPPPVLAADDRRQLAQLMSELRAAFERVRAELRAGRVPPADALEAARTALLKLPAAHLFSELGHFVRATLFSLLAALRAPAPEVAALQALVEAHAKELERAVAEVDQSIGAVAGGGRAFWESSI